MFNAAVLEVAVICIPLAVLPLPVVIVNGTVLVSGAVITADVAVNAFKLVLPLDTVIAFPLPFCVILNAGADDDVAPVMLKTFPVLDVALASVNGTLLPVDVMDAEVTVIAPLLFNVALADPANVVVVV